ncbi:MAG: DUF2442 domain-containing protein [Verrucomicrobia bacterium]|nr:DUF2442 domain-containing protein [Verrucomicrobiota bacterium]
MARIVTAQPLTGFRLRVRFSDGVEGIFPVEPERRGGVFLKLLDAKIFNAVSVNPDFGCVEWPGGVDLCPDTMHEAITGAAADLHAPMVLCEEPSSVTTVRAEALSWLASKLGVKSNGVYASKFYVPEKSWTRHSAWWFEIPQQTIETSKSPDFYLLCQAAPSAKEFHCLKIPVTFFREQLPRLCLRENGKVSLFLSAERDEMFIEQRGKGKIEFVRFLKPSNLPT